ncbi:MAG: cardiolipin synthase [Paludibacteraceae bacterium]|nr:cardiolipin synthase [Paludibacteraceae bacterium]
MSIFSNIVSIIVFGLVLSVIVLILLENRNPAKTLIWILLLILLPVIGLILYIFIGQDFRRKKIITKKSIDRISRKNITKNLNQILAADFEQMPNDARQIANLLSNNSELPIYAGNRIETFTSGKECFDAFFTDIQRATEHIHIEFYIIANDTIGIRLRDLLIKKAKEGVRIRVIYDYLGSFSMNKKFLQPLKDAGAYVQAFLPIHRQIGLSKINYRNHRKLIIIDGKIGYTGGMNIANRYIMGNHLGLWRDTMVRFEGAAVHGLQNAFLVDWYFVESKLISDKKYYPTPRTFDNNFVQIVSSGPDTDWESIMQGITAMIHSAKKYIYIHTPYFLPTEPILSALQIASLSGVDVRLMLPQRVDTKMIQLASHSYLKHILESGVRVFFYQNNFLHSKAIVADDYVSTIGTANMDFRSYEQNFELNAFIYDEKTATSLRLEFENDLKSCKEITLEEWKKRKKIDRLKDSVARIFSPIM